MHDIGFAGKSRLILLISCLSLGPSVFAQSANTIKRLTPEAAKALLEDADSIARITAEARISIATTPINGTWKSNQDASLKLSLKGDFREAVRAAGLSILQGEKEGIGQPALALAKVDMARAFSYSGNLELAEKFASEALGHNAGQWYYASVKTRGNKTLGDVAARRGDFSKAIEYYRESDKHTSVEGRIFVRTALANAFMLAGKLPEAIATYQDVKSYQKSPVREMIARLAGELALRQGNHEEAVARFREYGQGATGEDGAYHRVWALDGEARALLAKGDQPAAVKLLLEATTVASGLRARFYSEEIITGLFGEMEAVFSRAVIALTDSGDHQRAFEIAEASRARALSDQVRGRVPASMIAKTAAAIGTDGKRVNPADVIGATEVLVVYFVAQDQTIAWVRDKGGLKAVKLAITRDQLRQEVQRMRVGIVERSPQVRERGLRLHDVLVKPLGLTAEQGLIIVPHDALHHLPFQALWNGERYLIQSHAISYAPSLDSLAHIVRTRDANRSMKIVAFGNPDLGSDSLALPGAELEVNNIKVAYPDTLTFLRTEATKPRFVLESPKHAMVHVAAHAEFDALDPLYSRVRLAPENGFAGAIEAHEIYKLNFANTSLITLSACESGMSRITRGDEIWGFTRSFLAAGAPALVLSLWPVADESTEKIMTTFYKEMREVNPREAIRRAQLLVGRDPRFEHPFFWAPFNLIGDWR